MGETNAEKAGWNPQDGPAPFQHATPVAPIAEADRPEDLPNE